MSYNATDRVEYRVARGAYREAKYYEVETTFALFYSFELKLCKMVELCIPKNPMFFGFQMAKQINNFERA